MPVPSRVPVAFPSAAPARAPSLAGAPPDPRSGLRATPRPGPGRRPDPGPHIATATLGLGHLHERRGETLIRIPVHRRQQDPGCEWHAHRVGGQVTGLDLTCETLEDWTALAAASPEVVPTLYRDLLGREDIPAADLFWERDVFVRGPDGPRLAFAAGSYNPLNAWNTVRGAVHLTGPAGDSPLRGGLRLPEAGLLHLGPRDVTAEVLRPRRRDDRTGRVLRLEVAPPPGASYALDDLVLPRSEPFTPFGLVRRLALGIPREGWDGGGRVIQAGGGGGEWEDWQDDRGGLRAGTYAIPVARTMPGVLVAAAMLRAMPGARA